MLLDLLLARRPRRTAPLHRNTFPTPLKDDFRDTVPSMFWLDSEPPANVAPHAARAQPAHAAATIA